ncbi:MAG: hypothetical protein ACRDN0_03665 [Trebonia sp.]
MSRYRAASVPLLAVGAALALAVSLTGCDALGKLGTTGHYPAATSFTVDGRVTTVVIEAGSGSVDVTAANRSSVAVSQQASYATKPPVARHTLSGTTLTLSYTCAVELTCGISYSVQVPRGVAVRVSAGAGAITLTALSGAVSAQTSAGLITAVDLVAADANLKSNAGGIIATWSVPPRSLRASTDLGAITLTVPGSVAYKISTHTFVSTSTITVRRSASSPYAITTSSDVGSVSISPG